ncbi:MAG TPA: hypothetical protein VHU60_06100 [Gaiellaceae bacterium]|jgi:hypothetical protein|nr:hypothetical protein [Gaiellaceae bacterium]
MIASRLKRLFVGGSAGNEQLTLAVAGLLLVLLAVEGATLLDVRSFLTVHAFVGMLLIPVIALKAASTGWRLLSYYRGGEEYVRRGPPHVVLRMLVAPVLGLSTVVLFGTGVGLLALHQTEGTLVGLHKASFIVWLGAAGLHVLAHLLRLPGLWRLRAPGVALRVAVVGASLATGALLATATLPAADRLQDQATGHVGFDER